MIFIFSCWLNIAVTCVYYVEFILQLLEKFKSGYMRQLLFMRQEG